MGAALECGVEKIFYSSFFVSAGGEEVEPKSVLDLNFLQYVDAFRYFDLTVGIVKNLNHFSRALSVGSSVDFGCRDYTLARGLSL